MSITIHTGDALTMLHTLPAVSCDCCVTSPPYYGLRDYGVNGQIGLEETPEAYIGRLVDVFREVRRVLRDDGTLWVNIGDSYATGSMNAHDGERKNRNQTAMSGYRRTASDGLKSKDLIGIPWLLAFALRADGWYLRQDIIWHKPNPMPESVRDRCTKAHEYIFLLSKSERYYFDGEAIKEPAISAFRQREKQNGESVVDTKLRGFNGACGVISDTRNKRNVWTVATHSYKGAHFAVFPPELVRPCILAGSRPGGVVLDPFFGSGTTGLVSQEEGRDCIGIDINPEYVQLAQKRVSGMKDGAP